MACPASTAHKRALALGASSASPGRDLSRLDEHRTCPKSRLNKGESPMDKAKKAVMAVIGVAALALGGSALAGAASNSTTTPSTSGAPAASAQGNGGRPP